MFHNGTSTLGLLRCFKRAANYFSTGIKHFIVLDLNPFQQEHARVYKCTKTEQKRWVPRSHYSSLGFLRQHS
eukprot:c29770_g1_i1 orf=358-573(+)